EEARDVVDLVSRLDKDDRLLALCFYDRSAYFDESNGVLHYLGVHHTARTGGVTSLFWGKYAKHLPVGYREGREPSRPPDWFPSKFTSKDVQSATHVLVTWPDQETIDTARLRAMNLDKIDCRGRTCLYAVNPSD